jgi:predicted metal-dependent hydrolase
MDDVTGRTKVKAVLYKGKEYPLEVIEDGNPRPSVRLAGDRIVVTVPRATGAAVRAALEAWYRREARVMIRQAVWRLNRGLGLRYERIMIRNQRTRWGSCSSRRNLSFNIKLITAPQQVVDYVVLHELMHLKEHNHSPKFWRLVQEKCPQYKQYESWLKENALKTDI